MPGAPRPRMLVCYICGSEFGTRSLSIHEPQCLKKWEGRNALLPRGERGVAPQKPSASASGGGGVAAANDAAYEAYTGTMEKCGNCGRTFAQSRLAVHLRSCKPGTAHKSVGRGAAPRSPGELEAEQRKAMLASPEGKATATFDRAMQGGSSSGGGRSPQKLGRAPPTKLCYLCGNQFGTASISIHEAACLKKFDARQAALPRRERQPRPSKPQKVEGASAREENDAAYAALQSNQAACPNCGRTFSGPDRLEIHLRSCGGGASERGGGEPGASAGAPLGASPGGGGGVRATGAPPRPRFLVCYVCRAEFGSRSIAIHEPQCLKKWEGRNALLPRGEQRASPVKPSGVQAMDDLLGELGSIEAGGADYSDRAAVQAGLIDLANDAAYDAYKGNLDPCPHCGRTFAQARLAVHLRSCGGKKGVSKRVGEGAAPRSPDQLRLDVPGAAWDDGSRDGPRTVRGHNPLPDQYQPPSSQHW